MIKTAQVFHLNKLMIMCKLLIAVDQIYVHQQ